MNHVILIGYLADNPQASVTTNGISKCTFRLATQRKYTNPQTGKLEADFHNIVVWRQLADLCTQYLAKGRQCAVRGSIQYRSYEAQDGSKRYVTEIIADTVEFLGSANRQREGGQQASQSGYATSEAFTPVDVDELPF